MDQTYSLIHFKPLLRDRGKMYWDSVTEGARAVAEAKEETKTTKEPTAAEKRAAEEKAADQEAERAEKQRLLALRLQFGPIRDPE